MMMMMMMITITSRRVYYNVIMMTMMITILSRCDYYDSNETSREDEDAFSKEAEHVKIPQQKNKVIFNPQTKLNACFGPHE